VWTFQRAFRGRYPFILLNLILSCLAAVQAPVIMMSQKRQEARDRLRSQNDYEVNLKAELEIRHLHEKIDHVLQKQAQRAFEIQQIQLETLSDLFACGRPYQEHPDGRTSCEEPEPFAAYESGNRT
jgi:uncharacterized membrane protein